ncbi:NUDIX hydrolase [Actinomarinicola tropica]|uniref:NUDIX domain-containing protein n=1 Tax=Actinomarinicola tropica TaxID=2789776 RepID=A0A5Q2RHE2_9ACTN|nr:NUDIX hydrolase [Actinomarinicola tropica]QGG93961.1 NUDIX domain-containing protein [Actinomarinicola tropica]
MSGGTLVRAAGAVVWRRSSGGGEVEVLLVHRPRHEDWSLPKGKLDPGESWEDAACREIEEETGVVGALGRELCGAAYTVAEGPKLVRYWLMSVVSDRSAERRPDDEVDEARWCVLDEARSLLDHDLDRVVLRSASLAW